LVEIQHFAPEDKAVFSLNHAGLGRREVVLGNVELRTVEQTVVEADFRVALG